MGKILVVDRIEEEIVVCENRRNRCDYKYSY